MDQDKQERIGNKQRTEVLKLPGGPLTSKFRKPISRVLQSRMAIQENPITLDATSSVAKMPRQKNVVTGLKHRSTGVEARTFIVNNSGQLERLLVMWVFRLC